MGSVDATSGDRGHHVKIRPEQGATALLPILALLLAAGCGLGVPASQVLPDPPPPPACVDAFSGNVSRTCR